MERIYCMTSLYMMIWDLILFGEGNNMCRKLNTSLTRKPNNKVIT